MTGKFDVQISTSLFEKVEYALKYAEKALGSADPLVPFTICWQGEHTTIERYMRGAYDDSIELAMSAINDVDETVEAYAVVWNGYIEADGQKMESIILEAGDRFQKQSVQLAQPYMLIGDRIELIGTMLALGSSQNLLMSKLNAFTLSSHLIKPAYVSTEGFKMDVASQPYAKMPAAIICLAANLCEGNENERITAGIRALQDLESKDGPALSHRVFTVSISMIADGDLMKLLGTQEVKEIVNIIVEGITQLQSAVKKGLVGQAHVLTYYADLAQLLHAVLTDNGKAALPVGGERVMGFFNTALAA